MDMCSILKSSTDLENFTQFRFQILQTYTNNTGRNLKIQDVWRVDRIGEVNDFSWWIVQKLKLTFKIYYIMSPNPLPPHPRIQPYSWLKTSQQKCPEMSRKSWNLWLQATFLIWKRFMTLSKCFFPL